MQYEEDIIMKGQRLIAFWKYDAFPYCLYSEVHEFLPGGRVRVKGYGRGNVLPIAILPYKEGLDAAKSLEELRSSYGQALRAVHTEFREQLKNIAPFIEQ
jgi:hypothetical protein